MAYYVDENGNQKKVISVTKVEGKVPEYEGSYNVTENGTLPTSGKKMTSDLVVNITATKTKWYGTINYHTSGSSDRTPPTTGYMHLVANTKYYFSTGYTKINKAKLYMVKIKLNASPYYNGSPMILTNDLEIGDTMSGYAYISAKGCYNGIMGGGITTNVLLTFGVDETGPYMICDKDCHWGVSSYSASGVAIVDPNDSDYVWLPFMAPGVDTCAGTTMTGSSSAYSPVIHLDYPTQSLAPATSMSRQGNTLITEGVNVKIAIPVLLSKSSSPSGYIGNNDSAGAYPNASICIIPE